MYLRFLSSCIVSYLCFQLLILNNWWQEDGRPTDGHKNDTFCNAHCTQPGLGQTGQYIQGVLLSSAILQILWFYEGNQIKALLTTTGKHLLIFSDRHNSWPFPEKIWTVSWLSSAQSRHNTVIFLHEFHGTAPTFAVMAQLATGWSTE